MQILMNEFRYALRQLYNSPWFTVTVVLTLALGIGANTAVFSVMNAVLLKGLPVPNPQELVYLHVPSGQPDGAGNTGDSTTSFSEPVFEDLRQDHHAFADLIAFVPLAIGKVAVRSGDTPEEVEGDMVSGNFFSGLGVSPARGRGFNLEDERTHSQVAVLSHSYWTRRFSRSPSVLGQNIYIKGNAFTIIGVGPEGFFGVEPGHSTDIWIPLQSRTDLNAWGTPPEANTLYGSPTWWCLELIARLAPGVSGSQALAEVTPRYQRVAYPGLSTPDPKKPKVTLAFQPARGVEGLDTEHLSHRRDSADDTGGACAGDCLYQRGHAPGREEERTPAGVRPAARTRRRSLANFSATAAGEHFAGDGGRIAGMVVRAGGDTRTRRMVTDRDRVGA